VRTDPQALDRLVADGDRALDVVERELEVGDMQHRAGLAMPAAAAAIGAARPDRPGERFARLAGELRRPGMRAAIPGEGLAAVAPGEHRLHARQAGAVRGRVAELRERRGEAQHRIGRAEEIRPWPRTPRPRALPPA
jgi:hypothetical protein